MTRATRIARRVFEVLRGRFGVPVFYTPERCHPRAYASRDFVVTALTQCAEGEEECARLRRNFPRHVVDYHHAAGRVVVRRAPKRWWER